MEQVGNGAYRKETGRQRIRCAADYGGLAQLRLDGLIVRKWLLASSMSLPFSAMMASITSFGKA